MPTKILAVSYHRQETPTYCGAASLQMVIEALGLPSKSQDDLYIDAHDSAQDPQTNWYSSPDGLERTLDDVKGLQPDFDLVSLTSESSLSRRLVWSVYKASVAPIALVYGWTHWVVVVGYDISADPTGPTDTGYTIAALEIQDPWRTVEEGNPPPPPPPRHVAYAEWLYKYLKPVPDGYWTGKRVAVGEFVDTAKRKKKKKVYLVAEPLPVAGGSTMGSIISPDDARTAAIKGLEQYGLLTRPDWQPLLSPPVAPQKPVLVQRLDVVGDYYYLVPFAGAERKTEAVIRVDGLSGEYLEASAIGPTRDGRSWSTVVADWAGDETTRRRIVGRRFELPGRAGRVLARSEGMGVHPSSVWKPCIESLSPYYPFRLVTIGDTLRYVRVDGEVFDALHEAGPGM